ncbi:MAG TPA: excalibur calcium-binding domain-containing protein [Chloroflexia bacterium]|nr:excalibur calcium-binding domain-containing protein [Chloroflexia bacterium]
MAKRIYHVTLALVGLVLVGFLQPFQYRQSYAQPTCQTFKETGKSACGYYLEYWLKNGRLAQQGYPISEPFNEISETNGKSYAVQYFERAVFELHPENAPPYNILLSLLGTFEYQRKHPTGAPGQQPNNATGSVIFKETGKRLGGRFLEYWNANGKLPQQGYPISDEFMEKSDLDGKTYRVQYFERAVFEMHPENKPPFDVLLSQLGTFHHRAKYGAISIPPTPTQSSGGVCGTPYDPFGEDRDCSDFATHEQAQCFFLAAGGPATDRHRLDGDGDGEACEDLP